MAITPEDGSVVSGANSYVSVSDSDSIADELLIDPSEWITLSQNQKEKYLKRATRELDLKNNWASDVKDTDQALGWPREEFEDAAGRTVKDDIVPQLVKEATVFLAHNQVVNGSTFAKTDKVTEESYGDTSVTYAGVSGDSVGEADFFLKLLRSKGYASSTSIVNVYRS